MISNGLAHILDCNVIQKTALGHWAWLSRAITYWFNCLIVDETGVQGAAQIKQNLRNEDMHTNREVPMSTRISNAFKQSNMHIG